MFQMLTCFNLKPGVQMAEFEAHLAEFTREMVALGLCTGCGPVMHRRRDTGLDTDDDRTHTHFFVMDFVDKDQGDRALAHIKTIGLKNMRSHLEVFRRVTDSIFICWDIPAEAARAG